MTQPHTRTQPTNFNKIQNGLNVAIGILNLSYEGNMADETPIFMRTVVGKLGFFLQLLKTPQVIATTTGFRVPCVLSGGRVRDEFNFGPC
jgi:hypothetical protein